MELLSLVSLLLFSVAAWIIGTRLWLLAGRTRGAPERSMAVLLLGIGGIGYPCMLLARSMAPVSIGYALLSGLAVLAINAGITGSFVFTWKVFHPKETWAKRITWTAGVLLIFIGLSAVAGAILGGGTSNPQGAALVFILANFLISGAAFLWSGCESWRYGRMLHRRVALGIGDPVVANRFMLWACQGASTTVINVANIVVVLMGGDLATQPILLAITGVCGIANVTFLTLAFLPPDFYLRWLGGDPAAARS